MMHNWGDGTGSGAGGHMWGDGWGAGSGTWMMSGGGAGLMWLWWIFAILAIGGVVYLAVRLANRPAKTDAPAAATPAAEVPATTPARQILEDRLARGEIDAEEFRDRVKALDEA
ncbi:SHOCT domain-containing protein [Demequina sp. NBRC 110052]|uniref:SHOCT domain-containing protein n=1 Tax=Demequina sp. NBRC 110052 TaxID=1570341 RepID=UPI001F39757F|nr:SHOCT domain-containing protein [Demequina sp. NBRC 110052]